MYVVCIPCYDAQEKDHGAMIGGRTRIGYYESQIPNKQLDSWFMKHSKCGGRANPDHFTIAYLEPKNHDQAVKLKAVQ